MFKSLEVDQWYLTHGTKLQEFNQTPSSVHVGMIHQAVEFIYSEDNIGCLVWVVHNVRQIKIRGGEAGVCICDEVLVLKHDIATMYKVYSEKYKDAMPGKPPIGRTLFYSIAKTSPKVRSRRYVQEWTTSIKVNFHTATLPLWTRLLMSLHRSQMWTTYCMTSCVAFTQMCTPSSVMGMLCM